MHEGRATARYGSWKSPITSARIAAQSIGLGQLWLDGGNVYWTESRPREQGRNVLMRRTRQGQTEEVLPAQFNVRTRVHEYGGGDYLVHRDTVYFSNFADQRVYRGDLGLPPQALTEGAKLRFADFAIDAARDRLLCVREDKRLLESNEDVSSIVAIAIPARSRASAPAPNEGRVVVSGNDFYASPRLSPDGTKLAFLTWNHPAMPWDAAELWVARLAPDGSTIRSERVAGGPSESIFQPEWRNGTLYFVSDRSGFWNIWSWRDGVLRHVHDKAAEFGAPQWMFGMATYAFLDDARIVCAMSERGSWRLAILDIEASTLLPIELPYTWFSGLRADEGRVVFAAAAPSEPAALLELDLKNRTSTVLQRSTDLTIDRELISVPEAIEFPTEGGLSAHAFYYRPTNPDYAAPLGERPPLIVKSHGGPTGAASNAFALGIQYWTSRGFAVLDVNYGGSTGYGRAYRERLKRRWGIVDVDDCVNGARYLVRAGAVDERRLVITGGSAGGYTTLCALTFRDVFSAGASHFGISDLEIMASDMRSGNPHKFESRYDEWLVAPYPEGIETYRARSPIAHTDQLSCPIIFFQGKDDRIVLPNQAERMVDVLRQKRLPVAYLAFSGEGHGFRRAENIQRVLDAELYFYARVFGFELADQLEPVPIENL